MRLAEERLEWPDCCIARSAPFTVHSATRGFSSTCQPRDSPRMHRRTLVSVPTSPSPPATLTPHTTRTPRAAPRPALVLCGRLGDQPEVQKTLAPNNTADPSSSHVDTAFGDGTIPPNPLHLLLLLI
jgi:hypothetical protein